MKRCHVTIAVLLIAVSSCSITETEGPAIRNNELVFYASNECNPSTKTLLQLDGSIYWSPKEAINIFYGNDYSAKFVSTNTSLASEVEFHGSLDSFEYNGQNKFYAAYPYREDNNYDNGLFVSLPSEQKAVSGTFDNELFISVAQSEDFYLHFYNVCGGVKFSVTQEGVKKAVFSGNNNEPLAGNARVSFNDGLPVVDMVQESSSSITLTPPNGESFEVGKYYYIVSYPAELVTGYTLLLYDSEGKQVERVNNSRRSIKRSIWGFLEDADFNRTYIQPTHEIWYTTTDGKAIVPNQSFSQIISNVYEDGKGIITLDGDNIQIPSSAFNSCETLLSISLPSTVSTIGTTAFYGCSSLAEVSLSEGVTTIGTYAFCNCTNLTTVYLPSTLKTISDRVFHSCSSLKNITIPESVTSIGEYAFFCCSSIESIDIPKGIKEIPQNTFARCDNLTRVTLPEGLLIIGGGAFALCPNLQNITIPNTVTSLGDAVFSGCKSFTRMVVPDGIQTIGYSLFSTCDNLEEVVLPEGVTKINFDAFYKCSKLASIKIPKSVEIVSSSVFAYCTSLTEITFPSNISSLGDKVVENCTSLSKIVMESIAPPTIISSTFDASNNCPIYVPYKSVSSYKTAPKWTSYESRIVQTPIIYEYVDLGLSVKWATSNIGAPTPEEYGDYYAWGETKPYYDDGYAQAGSPIWKDGKSSGYAWSSYIWCNGSSDSLTKYNTDSYYGATIDGKTILEEDDDVAHMMLGEKWRMPTEREWSELVMNCTWTWTNQNGVNGYLVTAVNKNSIFLPAAGMRSGTELSQLGSLGWYWSSSLALGTGNTQSSSDIFFASSGMGGETRNRFLGFSVRPVYGDRIPVISVSLNNSSLSLVEGETITLTASVSPSNAFDKSILWLSDTPNVAKVNQNGYVIAVSPGTANITVTTIDGNKTASCKVTVYAAPVLDFNTNSYLIYKANPSGGWDARNENYYHYESYLSGFSARVVEMKFQLASSSDTYCCFASDNTAKDWYQELKFSTTQLIWNQGDPTDYHTSISLSDAGVSRTSLITLRFDGNAKTLSINGKSYSVPYDVFDFSYLLAEYFRENDEGVCLTIQGIPNGSKIYYIKGWDANGNLVYLGYPTKAINPKTSVEEYCWYTYWNKNTTYQFANDSLNQGGYNGYIP